MMYQDCGYLLDYPGDWSEFWGAMVQEPDFYECEHNAEDKWECENCPYYSPRSRIDARITSPYDCDLEDV